MKVSYFQNGTIFKLICEIFHHNKQKKKRVTCVIEPSLGLPITTPSGGIRWMERPASLTVGTILSWERDLRESEGWPGPRGDGEPSLFICLTSRRWQSSRGIPERERVRQWTPQAKGGQSRLWPVFLRSCWPWDMDPRMWCRWGLSRSCGIARLIKPAEERNGRWRNVNWKSEKWWNFISVIDLKKKNVLCLPSAADSESLMGGPREMPTSIIS